MQKSDNKSVTVSILASSACSGCHAEGICSLSGREERIVEIPGIFQVVPGDSVTVLMKQSSGYSAVFLGYVLPLILESLSVTELIVGLGALAILIPYYLTLCFFSDRINKKFTFTIKV